ncbi:hypothetical protein [Ornithinimicrobium kibberense]|uniref:hypothetical protein n=1 Tax=Ornithinimicrobium kibberense TaxID=282060 RepID=UPI00360FD26F
MGSITKMCERALWLDDGALVMDGPAADVVDAYAAKYGRPRKKSARKGPTGSPPEKT